MFSIYFTFLLLFFWSQSTFLPSTLDVHFFLSLCLSHTHIHFQSNCNSLSNTVVLTYILYLSLPLSLSVSLSVSLSFSRTHSLSIYIYTYILGVLVSTVPINTAPHVDITASIKAAIGVDAVTVTKVWGKCVCVLFEITYYDINKSILACNIAIFFLYGPFDFFSTSIFYSRLILSFYGHLSISSFHF